MADRRYKMTKADLDLLRDLDRVKIQRIKNDLETRKLSDKEVMRMMRNTSTYSKVLEELSTIPRRNNGK